MAEKCMYGIDTTSIWIHIKSAPHNNPLSLAQFTSCDEEPPKMEFDTLESAVAAMIERYADKIYEKEVYRGKALGIETLICYVVDSDYNVAAALNYDKTVIYK